MGNPRPKPERLAEKLLALRHKLGVSQLNLSRQLDVDAVRLHEYETGKREPNLMVLLRYARLSKVSVESLIDDEMDLTWPASQWQHAASLQSLLAEKLQRCVIDMGHARRRPKRLAEKLLQIRKARALSQGEMVNRLGVEISAKHISRYERDQSEPPIEALLAYARAANIRLEQIVDDEFELKF